MSIRKIILTILLGLTLVVGIVLFFVSNKHKEIETKKPVDLVVPTVEEPTADSIYQRYSVIGNSIEGRVIESYSFGNGKDHLLFIGGIHGGYEWNSVLLAYKAIDYYSINPELVPDNITIDIIPNLNPDGTFKVIGKEGKFTLADVPADDGKASGLGRFNAHDVDLNRNFDCKWQPTSTWRSKEVSAGSAAFSEPEAATLRDYVATINPKVVVFWHSQANAVYASECLAGVLPGTTLAMNTYAQAAGYKAISSFDAYPVTGDAEGWLASINIPAITVELATHTTLEWEKNLAGISALIKVYDQLAK